MGKKERVSWITNGLFKRDDKYHFNINTVVDLSFLAKALGFLIGQEDGFKKACIRLGISNEVEFKWDGYTVKEWEEDFATRVRVVEWNKQKKSLDGTKKKLATLVSEEARTEMELSDIKKSLGI